ncbi:Sec-independent protein translocase protein TatB [Halomonas sp. Bachu 37]|uniref:Sec-independent protein translocase protein TatB n=1 Tax=Halomonas kashgarensis TaxID=3084920 RepID=UPI00321692BA
MFDMGFLELLIIAVVGLLVLGPERLPKAARTLGLWIGKIKRTVSGMQREINAQLEAEELRQKLNEQHKKLDDSLQKAKRDVESLGDSPAAKPSAESEPQETAASDAEDSTQTRVDRATSRLDDALATVRDTAPEQADPQKDADSR